MTTTWLTGHCERRADFFVKPDPLVLPSLRATSAWASTAGYEPAGVNIFLQAADYYLVAHAHAHNQTVVTHERPSPSTKKINIPDACIGNEVADVGEMLQRGVGVSVPLEDDHFAFVGVEEHLVLQGALGRGFERSPSLAQ